MHSSSANLVTSEYERRTQRNSRFSNESLNLHGQTEQEDPFEFLIAFSRISPSQEDLLLQSAFVAESDDEAPPSSTEAPSCSAGVLMVSLLETQVAGKDASGSDPQDIDVFHTPPENSSLPSSGDQRLDHCTVDQVIDVYEDTVGFVDLQDSQGTGCVDLGRDSDLGFVEVQLKQRVNGESVAECSRDIKRYAVDDEFGVVEKELCSQDGICELPVKKWELSMQKSCLDSSGACLGVESQKVEEGNGDCKRKRGSGAESPCNDEADIRISNCVLGGEQVSGNNGISMLKNMGSRLENAINAFQYREEGQQKKNLSDFDALKFLKENYDDDEDDSFENAANELESFEERQRKNKSSIFDALKFLKDKEDDPLENVSLLDAFMLCDMTFPRPRWWPDNDFFRKQKLA